jgi:hypothetical protein
MHTCGKQRLGCNLHPQLRLRNGDEVGLTAATVRPTSSPMLQQLLQVQVMVLRQQQRSKVVKAKNEATRDVLICSDVRKRTKRRFILRRKRIICRRRPYMPGVGVHET